MTDHPIPYELTADDQLVFLHLAKTAGTTFVFILEQFFAPGEICPAYWLDEILKIPYEELTKYRLFRGHFHYDLHTLLPKKPVYITILRDPIERIISHFDQLRRTDDPIWAHIIPKRETLADFVKVPHPKPAFRNYQTRTIARSFNLAKIRDSLNRPSLRGLLSFSPKNKSPLDHSLWPESLDKVTGMSLGRWPMPDDELLETAKKRLSEFAFVGLTERFQDSMYLLSYTFGWPAITRYEKRRVAQHRLQRKDIPGDIVKAIVEHNQLDIKLHQYAQQLFEKRFSQMTRDLEKRFSQTAPSLTLPDLLERHYQLCCAQKHPPIETLYFTFDQAMRGTSWHAAESHPVYGTYRWTGPNPESSIDLPLAAEHDLAIEFSVIHAIAPDILESLSLSVNGEPIALTARKGKEGATVFEGTIPRSALSKNVGFTRLVFRVNRVVSPESLDMNNDPRKVGVAINYINITLRQETIRPEAVPN